MPTHTVRLLILFAALLLVAGAALHASGFRHALPVIDASGLPHFYSSAFKALWFLDSLTQVVLAAILCAVLANQLPVSRALLWLLALIPVGTAAILCIFLGRFPAEYLFLIITALLFAAGFQVQPWRPQSDR